MPRKAHTHKYIKRQTGSSPVWACGLEDCNHFMPPHLNSLLEGRSSYCWSCDDKFRLDSIALEDDRPKCQTCRVKVMDFNSLAGIV